MKRRKIFFIILFSTVAIISSVLFYKLHDRSNYSESEKKIFLRLKRNAGPVLRGFQYSKYCEGQKSLSIKAAKLSVAKKKFGIFKLAPLKVAMFRDAQIDLFGETGRPNQRKDQERKFSSADENSAAVINGVSFKGILSPETLPPPILEGSISAIGEPALINLYIDDEPITQIQAEKAIIDPRKRRMILRGNVQVVSGFSQLTTNRLEIYPETGLFEIDDKYALKSQNETYLGENLTTDFFLQKVSSQ